MKFRWKLLILLLGISIVPVVSLRTFGIHNVHLMADALVSEVKRKQVAEAKDRMQLIINEYSRSIRSSREQIEMALFYQSFELRRILHREIFEFDRSRPSLSSVSPEKPATEKIGVYSDDSVQCFSVPPSVDADDGKLDIDRLKRMTPIYEAISLYLGNLILRQYFGLENGLYTVYPCDQETRLPVMGAKQSWYRSALEDKVNAWSRPYVDPISGRIVMAVSLPIEREDESVVGVTSLLVPLSSLLELALPLSEIPPDSMSYLFTLAFKGSTDIVGAKILASAQYSKMTSSERKPTQENHWLNSSDTVVFRAMLEDIARQQNGIREMPFQGRKSYWAYGPLLHQGSGFVFIVARDEVLAINHPVLKSIQSRVSKVEYYTAGFLIILVLVGAALALTFSRTITLPLEKLSRAAQKLAKGDFDSRVSVKSRDELGDVGRVFNRIGPELKEHYRMRRSLEVAMEIQQNLLPETPPTLAGLEIYGMTLFSDETGGDYFDYMCIDQRGQPELCVAVGDVSGHGIPSALLMATVRAFLRMRATLRDALGDIVSDVNREFSKDVGDSGQFVTFFLARIDRYKNRLEWVRAGHEPAILYDPDTDSFKNLNGGKGPALGVLDQAAYMESSCEIRPGQIIYIGTDGIWEARNAEGNMFGKERVKQVIRKESAASAQTIVLSILDAVRDFCSSADQEDDLTVTVVKVKEQ
jgi:sigma-B regulation protein RsbU (phosphoserine phosphatase)